MRVLTHTATIGALLLLAACGQSADDSLALRLVNLARSQGGGIAPVPVETEGFTAQLIADNPQNYMVIDVPTIGLNQPARIIAVNGAEETWQAQGGPTFAYDDGILVATRGLIDDLLVIGSAGVPQALAAGGGTVTRVMDRLDSRDQLSSVTLTCDITSDGPEMVNLGLREVSLRKFTETCRSQELVFENAYWLDGADAIIASRQFVSATVAYLRANRL